VDRNLTLWADGSDRLKIQAVNNCNVSRCWCDPSSFVDVVGVDFGSCEMHLYSSAEKRGWKVAASGAREAIVGLQPGTLVVAEWAHLATPRTARSLAQPFSAAELLELYRSAEACGITIKMFPHYHSGTRAREWSAAHFPAVQSAKKGDPADAMAIALYVMHRNAVSLADPPKCFSRNQTRDYGRAVREYSSIALNAERTSNYDGRYFPHVVDLGCEIHRRRGKRIGEKACHSIASLIATQVNGSPFMFVRNGRPPGVDMWWRHVARMTPFHHRGGVARSNLMRHAFRPFLRKFGKRNGVMMGSGAKIVPFGEHDDNQALTRTLAMKDFRDCAKDCYRVGVDVAVKRGFQTIDPLQTPWRESAHGR
jgi:hypothetical protein